MERSASSLWNTLAAEGCWTLSDDRAGNVRQASALARALGVQGREWLLRPRAPWRWVAPRMLPGSRNAFGPDFAAALDRTAALAIGCGRQGALATRLARAHGAKTVQLLDPRLPPALWDIVIAPCHDGLQGDNVLSLLGSLNPVDDSWLRLARDAFPALGRSPRPRIAFLLGGPSPQVRFGLDSVGQWLDALDTAIEQEGGQLMLAASRRTPVAFREAIRARYANRDALLWLDDTDGTNAYAGMLAWADRIVCSPDSVNMISEACGTYVPVFVANAVGIRGRIRAFIDDLVAAGRVRPLEAGLAPFKVEPLRETERIARELKERL